MEVISLSNHLIRKALCLSLNEMAVLCQIHRMATPKYNMWCVQSKAKMADFLDLNTDTVFRAISALEAKGLVERNEQGHCKPSEFVYNLNAAEDIAVYIRDMNTEMVSFRVKQISDSGTQAKLSLSENPTPTIGKSDNDLSENPIAPIGKSDTSIRYSIRDNKKDNNIGQNDDFDRFWKKYPKRVRKIEAQKAWKKMSAQDRLAAIELMDNYLKSVTDKKFLQEPQNYLKSRRWEDEPIQQEQPQQSTRRPFVSHLRPEDNQW